VNDKGEPEGCKVVETVEGDLGICGRIAEGEGDRGQAKWRGRVLIVGERIGQGSLYPDVWKEPGS